MRRLVFGSLLVACVPAGSSADATPPSSAPDPMFADALEVLCDRVAARNVSAWGQAMLPNDSLGDLPMRVDAGEATARCELGRLMRRHARRACHGSIPRLVASCGD